VLALLFVTSQSHYLLFHSIIEGFGVLVALSVFGVGRVAGRNVRGSYLGYVGIGFAFVAGVLFLHLLAYKGMGVWPEYGPDLATQLWLVSRYLLATAFVASPLLVEIKGRESWVAFGYAAMTTLLLASIFLWGVFPVAFVEGQGLTPFKVVSEYVVIGLFGIGLGLLLRQRDSSGRRVSLLLAVAMGFFIATELSFTLYVDVYGFFNMLGHLLQFVAFALVLRAVILGGLEEPTELLYFELAQSNERLEERVAQRTAQLQVANDSLVAEVDRRTRAQRELARTARALKALSGVNEALVRAQSEQELLASVCCSIVNEAGYRWAWVDYALVDDEKSVIAIESSGADVSALRDLQFIWGQGARETPGGRAIRDARPVVVPDTSRGSEFRVWREYASECGIRSSVGLPLIAPSGEAFGALSICAEEPDAFVGADIELLREMADDISFGVETLQVRQCRTEMAQDLLAANERLEGLLRSIIETMGVVVEVRDPYTMGHQRRVARLAMDIATEIDMPERLVSWIEITGLLHDIGKLPVPTEILSKPGRLSAAELAIIQQHPETGHEILQRIDFGWPVAEVVLQHHERLDGSGYPRGLRGEEIGLPARILAVADVVEAMASDRPYRASLGLEAAMSEIQTQTEKFDSRVVAACLRLYSAGRIDFSGIRPS
jgi:putative nucleotidyltransferase with HDIG domain